jgi:hypothetical protein
MGLASAGEYAAEEARLEKLQLRLAQLQEALELAQEQVGTAVEAVRKAGTAGVKVLGSMKVAVGDASKAVSRAAETMSAISSFASSAGSMATSVINAGTSSRRVRDDTQEGSQVWGTVKQAAKQAASSALQQAALGLVNTSKTLGETAVEVVGTAVQRRKQIQDQASAIEWQQELLQRMMQQVGARAGWGWRTFHMASTPVLQLQVWCLRCPQLYHCCRAPRAAMHCTQHGHFCACPLAVDHTTMQLHTSHC